MNNPDRPPCTDIPSLLGEALGPGLVRELHGGVLSVQLLHRGVAGPPDSAVAVQEAGERDGGEGGAGEDDDHDDVGHGLRHVAVAVVADLGGGGVEEGGPSTASESAAAAAAAAVTASVAVADAEYAVADVVQGREVCGPIQQKN